MARVGESLPPGLAGGIALSLRIGIALAAGLLLLGTFLALAHGSLGALTIPTPVAGSGFAPGAGWIDGRTVLLLGVIVLLLTPIARVLLSMALFARARDGAFTLITGIVLVILAASVFLGAGA